MSIRQAFQTPCEITPLREFGQGTYEKALQHLEEGSLLLAESLLKSIVPGDGSYFLSISLLATLAYESGHHEKSIAYLEEARSIAPVEDNSALLGLATVYKSLDDLEKNREVLSIMHEEYPDDNVAAAMYIEALSNNREYAAAEIIIDKLLRLFPNDSGVLLAKGDILEKQGELDQAVCYFRKTIAADVFHLSAYTKIVAFNGWEEGMFDVDVLESMVESCVLPSIEIALIHNSLGSIYETKGEYDLSLKHYGECNKIYRKTLPTRLLTAPWTIDQLKNTYTPDLLAYANKEKQSPLVFILGMPRSGSTLLEQILINSPDVETLGEFRGINEEIESLGKRIGDDLTEETFPEDCSELGEQYLCKRVGDIESKFIIDKMPANHNYIGLLYLLFPNAKFIYSRRDPAAVCFSNWTTIYREGHQYSYTFEEMVEQYKFHEEVMEFWLDAMPGAIHVVDYEDIVNDFDTTVGKLCDYIGIDFINSMKNFYKKKRKVDTASVGQVTKPIYKTSLNRVGKFGSRLDELKELLT